MTNIVICQACFSPIYECLAVGRDHAGSEVIANDFIPLSDDIRQPTYGQEMLCPFCHNPFVVECCSGDSNLILLLEDMTYWPYPPIPGNKSY